MQKKQHEKAVKSKVVAQKWLWWSDNGKILLTITQVIFKSETQICLNCCY